MCIGDRNAVEVLPPCVSQWAVCTHAFSLTEASRMSCIRSRPRFYNSAQLCSSVSNMARAVFFKEYHAKDLTSYQATAPARYNQTEDPWCLQHPHEALIDIHSARLKEMITLSEQECSRFLHVDDTAPCWVIPSRISTYPVTQELCRRC